MSHVAPTTERPPSHLGRTERTPSRDDDRLTHIVNEREKVREAMYYGFPVEALCGKRWVPRRWKPKGGVRCRVCDDIARKRYPVTPGA